MKYHSGHRSPTENVLTVLKENDRSPSIATLKLINTATFLTLDTVSKFSAFCDKCARTSNPDGVARQIFIVFLGANHFVW